MRLGVGLDLMPLSFIADLALLFSLAEPVATALAFLRNAAALRLLV